MKIEVEARLATVYINSTDQWPAAVCGDCATLSR
jgi:hypothetical protein